MGQKNDDAGSAPRTTVGKGGRGEPRSTKKVKKSAAATGRPACDKCGEVHGRCAGHTKHGPNTGKPCGANPRAGALVCTKHGGNHPGQKKAAKERLLELVDPALAALHKVLTDPNTDDHNKVRAAQLVLDRTGFKPGIVIEVGTSPFDAMILAAMGNAKTIELDRGDPTPAALPSKHSWEDVDQYATDEQTEAWAEYDAEDERPYTASIVPDKNTVQGEVVGSILPGPPDTRGAATEYDDAHPMAWPYGVRLPAE